MPVTTSWPPARSTEVTSGSAASTAWSRGADGRNRIRCRSSTLATSPAGESSATRRPESITASRSQSRSASSMKCVTSTIVTPRSRIPSMRSHASRRACGSRPVVSSSSTATLGLPTSASAIDSRCFCPPDSRRNWVSSLSVRLQGVDQLPPVGRLAVEGAVQLHRLADLELVGQLALLQLRAEQLPQLTGVASRVDATDPDGPAVRGAQPLDTLDGRGLAGPVGPQDAEDLARLDGEADPVHRGVVAVALDEAVYLDDCHTRSVPCAPRSRIDHAATAGPGPDGSADQPIGGCVCRSG